MKNIKKYFGLTLVALLFSVVFSACEDKNDVGSGDLGLGIKVFSPTKVVTGQPVTINGSGFIEATEIIFPGGVSVKNFELVSNEMIRVVTPAGINIPAEGEKLIVRSADAEAESPIVMTMGNTTPTSYSEEPGADVKQKSIIKIYGKDMEFVSKVTFIADDDSVIELYAKDFYRIATNSLAIRVPANVKEGLQIAKFETLDGKVFELPEYNYVAAATGHWETVKTVIWENDGSLGDINWSGDYRYSNVETSTGEECYAMTMDEWDIIRNETFYVDIEGASPQIRVTTGWWSTTWTGNDITPGNENLVDNGDGTMTLAVNFAGDAILDVLDAQHLLFTGTGYKVLCIYSKKEVWVEDAEGHWERKSLWKNDGSLGDISWNGNYRFSNVETSTGEECYAFPMEDWEIIRTKSFSVEIEGASPQIRVTTGWWSTTWTGNDIAPGDEKLVDNGDGTMTLTVNFDGDAILDVLDAQHLLFTGTGYKVNEIYIEEWVEEGAVKPVVIWENDGANGAVNWNGPYRFGLEGNDGNNECIMTLDADTWSIIKDGTFYFEFTGDAGSNVRITTGWWTGAYGGTDYNSFELAEPAETEGNYVIKVNIKEDGNLYDNLDAQHLLFTGAGYTPVKIYYIK